MDKEQKKLNIFGYGLAVIFTFLAARVAIKHHNLGAGVILFALGIFMLAVTLVHRGTLKFIYDRWMRVGHAISGLFSSAILIILFYTVFSPLGLLFRLIRKDFLNRTWEPEHSTYWEGRDQLSTDPSRYKKQF